MRLKIERARSYMDALFPVRKEFKEPSLTRQDMADEVNINTIYRRTQQNTLNSLVLGSSVPPQYGDFEMDMPYDRMLEQINEADEAFMKLPAIERAEYGHSPQAWLEAQERKFKDKLTKDAKAKQKADADNKRAEELEAARKLVSDNDGVVIKKPE